MGKPSELLVDLEIATGIVVEVNEGFSTFLSFFFFFLKKKMFMNGKNGQIYLQPI